MKPVEFSEQTVIFAKDQPEYGRLPAWKDRSSFDGRIVCCWRFTWKERLKVLFSGVLWQQVLTFNQKLQPQLLSVDKLPMTPGGVTRVKQETDLKA